MSQGMCRGGDGIPLALMQGDEIPAVVSRGTDGYPPNLADERDISS